MFPEFSLDPPDSAGEAATTKQPSPEEKQQYEEVFSRVLKPKEKDCLTRLLLQRLKERKPQLQRMLEEMSGHWTYEDHFYRYYHGRFKVYAVQGTTEKAVKLLQALLPGRKLNMVFERIIREGTGKQFEPEHNEEWDRYTRPMLEAVAHAKFMVEMAMRYADLTAPAVPMPSGWAAFLYLYDLR